MQEFLQEFGEHKGHRLLCDPAFFAASMEQRMLVSNGCGPKGLGGKLVPDTMYGLDVSASCDGHDWRYRYTANTLKHKWRADIEMLGNAARIIVDAEGTTWLMVKRIYRATMYCAAVLLFGNSAFHNAKQEV